MSYELKKLEFKEALEQLREYEYGLIYMISELKLVRVEELEAPDWPECMEARFFSVDKELHIFDMDGEMAAVQVTDTGDGRDEIVKKYELANRFCHMGKYVYVKEYLNYDEDGQANVALTRLQGIG